MGYNLEAVAVAVLLAGDAFEIVNVALTHLHRAFGAA